MKNVDQDSKTLIGWRKYPKTRQKDFLSALRNIKKIKGTKQEDNVQAQWYAVLNYCFADYKENKDYATHIEKLLQTDGLMFVRNITVSMNLITEFKSDVSMSKRLEQEKILAQVIYYLKRIEEHIAEGNTLHLEMPNVVLAADVDQVFVINARVLWDYLKLPLGADWEKLNPRYVYDNLEPKILYERLEEDRNINPYVYDVEAKDFDVNDVIGLIADLAVTDDVHNLTKIPVTDANIRGVFDEFSRLVTQGKTKLTSQEQVGMFITALTDHDSFLIKKQYCYTKKRRWNVS
ncbi:hypothetical protein [Lactobacillus corticis]|uniref:Uncharacterized protein n=1 Tax=Lactobacillus corticis TaxID=2201249 RepID=A0A916QJG7_9LACO|nr:hypothetical protein [Lactobacillus corticis]GFZ27427.1 hypothetical protein LCB40_13070 [Lactobacillus corticis]